MSRESRTPGLVARALVSAAVLAVLVVLLPWDELWGGATRLRPVVWAVVLVLFLAGHRLGAAKWRGLVNVGRADLSSGDSIRFHASGLFANICLPSIVGGDVLRATLAARTTGRTAEVVLASAMDRLIDVVVLLVLMTGGALVFRRSVTGWTEVALLVGSALALLGGLLLVAAATRIPLSRWPRRVRRPVGRTLVALRQLRRRPGAAGAAAGASLVMQGGFVLLNAWIGEGVGIAVPLAAWFVVWPLAKLAALVPISLGGLGVREAALGGLLASVGGSMSLGVAASLVWQSIIISGGLLAGGLAYLLSRPSFSILGELRRAGAREEGTRRRESP